ncbi:MAG: DNA topoisomerase IB [Xanthomonadales bacterium]|nr:DNA topoisomerase IB [Xanthomonadales bacterium]
MARQRPATGLRWSNPSQPGIRRLRCGRGFRYIHSNGRPVKDADTLARIKALAIPPAYEQVWICARANGHLQATGLDARGRRQYRYHRQWRRQRDADKFSRMLDFGRALPALRRRLRADLAAADVSSRNGNDHDHSPAGPGRDQVLALLVSLLDATALRIGNAQYARDNRTFGLTTLRDRHAKRMGAGHLRLRFRGKGGQWQQADVDDPRLVRAVRRCQQLPGQTLFQYRDDTNRRRAVSSGMVNAYLRQAMAGDFTAKDFRSWQATVQALDLVCALPPPDGESALRSGMVQVAAEVAATLGHTPAVCRTAYINPVVFEAWRDRRLPKPAAGKAAQRRSARERRTLRLLARMSKSPPMKPPATR